MLGRPCPACGASAVELVLTETDEGIEAGFECVQCGAEYEKQSERGPYNALYDLGALLAQEEPE